MKNRTALGRYSQNFLKDQNTIRKIVTEIISKCGKSVIEIGPGRGAITGELIRSGIDLTAIEIDKELSATLQTTFPELKIFNEDFLEFDLESIGMDNLFLAGNLPYNITKEIFFKIADNHKLIAAAVFMVQDEVARKFANIDDRTTALQTLTKFYFDIEYLFKIPNTVFEPMPSVNSALILLKRNSRSELKLDHELFKKLVKTIFQSKRKTLKNSLKNGIFGNIDLSDSGVNLQLRPEELGINQLIILTRFLQGLQYDREQQSYH